MGVKLNCQHCSEPLTVGDGEWIDSGMTLHCQACDKDTIIDLFRPEERAKLYGYRTEQE